MVYLRRIAFRWSSISWTTIRPLSEVYLKARWSIQTNKCPSDPTTLSKERLCWLVLLQWRCTALWFYTKWWHTHTHSKIRAHHFIHSFPMTCQSPVLCYFHSRWRPLSLHSVVEDAPQWLLSHLSPSCHCVNASRALPFPQTFIWMAQSTLCVGVFCPLPVEWLFLICPYNHQCKRDGFSASELSSVWEKATAHHLGPPHLQHLKLKFYKAKLESRPNC